LIKISTLEKDSEELKQQKIRLQEENHLEKAALKSEILKLNESSDQNKVHISSLEKRIKEKDKKA
jgi:hypothetical protein